MGRPAGEGDCQDRAQERLDGRAPALALSDPQICVGHRRLNMNWNWVRENVFTPSRMVPLTAQLLTAGVGIVTTWLATKGWLDLDPAQVVGFVAPVVLGAEASIFKWQQGYQEYEKRADDRAGIVEEF